LIEQKSVEEAPENTVRTVPEVLVMPQSSKAWLDTPPVPDGVENVPLPLRNTVEEDGRATAVKAEVPFPRRTPERVPAPEPPWGTVTRELVVRTVVEASGKVKVLTVEGPVRAKYWELVPPLAEGRIPDTWEVSGIVGISARTNDLRLTAPDDPLGVARTSFWVRPVVAVMVMVPPRTAEPEEVSQVGVMERVRESFARAELGMEDNLELLRVPEEILEALVVSIVAEDAKDTPLVFRQVMETDPGPEAEQSPVNPVM